MIPALLSAVFVIYLYRELNRADSPEDRSPTNSAGDADDVAALTARVAALRERLERLVDQAPSGRTRP
jgi:hypothetical protein